MEVRRLQALIDRRQGNFEKAIQEFNEAVTRDPRNSVLLHDLALSLFATRQFTAAEQAFDRSIDLQPDERILKVEKAWFVTFMKTGDDAAFWSAIASLRRWLTIKVFSLCACGSPWLIVIGRKQNSSWKR